MPGFDLKQINRNDQLIIGGGALAFIFSFLPWYQISGGGHSLTWSAWQGFFGIFGVLLLLGAAAVTALRVFANASLPKLPVGKNTVVLAASGLGLLFILLEWLIFDPFHGLTGSGVSQGLAWGGYVLLVLAIAETVGAYLNFKASGEKLAWDATAMNKPAAAGEAPPATPYPPQSAPTYPPTAPAAPADSADPGTPGV